MFERWAKRIKKMTTAQVVSLAFSISVGVFALWTFLAAIVWGTFQIIGVPFNYWQMLEAVSTAAAVAQVFGGGVVALVQLTESIDNRNLSIYNAVFEKMMAEDNIEARRWIYQDLPPLYQACIEHVRSSRFPDGAGLGDSRAGGALGQSDGRQSMGEAWPLCRGGSAAAQ
jgi:hypothetical protein